MAAAASAAAEDAVAIVLRVHKELIQSSRCIVRSSNALASGKHDIRAPMKALRDKVSFAQDIYRKYRANGGSIVIDGMTYTQFDAMWASHGPLGCHGIGKPSAKLLASGTMSWIFESVLRDSDPAPPISWISKEFRELDMSSVERATRFRHMVDACHKLTKGSHDLYFGAIGLKMFNEIMGVHRV